MMIIGTFSANASARAAAVALVLTCCAPVQAREVPVQQVDLVETKAVYGRVETRDLVPARSRIGGTLTELSVTEGVAVSAGQAIGRVVDDKLALQIRAVDARRSATVSELANAQSEYDRARALIERGVATQQRVDQLRTQLDVLKNQVAAVDAERAVILQQSAEGVVTAPVAGRVVKAPVTRGAVLLPGEAVAMVAGGGYFLRLALPERHAATLRLDAVVEIGTADASPSVRGRIAKIFPQIENGRVIADVEVADLADYFVGSRVLVHVPVGKRSALVVPRAAVETRLGIDIVRLAISGGEREVAVVLGASVPTAEGSGVEVLTGLRAGDRVVMP